MSLFIPYRNQYILCSIHKLLPVFLFIFTSTSLCFQRPNGFHLFPCNIIQICFGFLTLQIPNSHYEKKTLKIGKNLLVFSKSLLVTVARTWDSLRLSMSQKVFSTSTLWLILSKNFLDLGIEFVYEKKTTYKIVSPRKSIFSMNISLLKVL